MATTAEHTPDLTDRSRGDVLGTHTDGPGRVVEWLIRTALLGAVLAIWQWTSLAFDWELYVSRPSVIAERMWAFLIGEYDFYENLRVTLVETALGFGIGTFAGLVVGIFLGTYRTVGRIVDPFLAFLNSVPRVALAPLFVFAMGFGVWSKVAVIISIVFFVMAANADAGVRNVDRDLVLAARILGANRRQVIRTIVGPSILVWLFPATRLSIAYSFLGVVIGEFVGASAGLGFYILKAANGLDTAGVMAAIVVLSLLSVGAIGIVGLIERRVLRWQP